MNALSSYLYRLNFILAVFNLAPGYPLDGGRVLRSIVWGITKDIRKATKIASTGGKVVASILILIGFLGFLVGLAISGLLCLVFSCISSQGRAMIK